MNRAKLCLLAIIYLLACGIFTTTAGADDAFVFDTSTNKLKHINSGCLFPFRVGDFEAGDDIRQYNPQGTDVSFPYNLFKENTYVAATVYIYAAPAPEPGRTEGDILNEHFEWLKTEILETYKGSFASEGKISLKGLAGRKAVFKIQLQGETESEVYLFTHNGWFIKYRISYPAKTADVTRPEVVKFINSLDLIPGK